MEREETDRQTETRTDRQRETHTDTHRDRQTDKQQTQKEILPVLGFGPATSDPKPNALTTRPSRLPLVSTLIAQQRLQQAELMACTYSVFMM